MWCKSVFKLFQRGSKNTHSVRVRPSLEDFEPRIMYSADAGQVLQTLPMAQIAEVRTMEAQISYSEILSANTEQPATGNRPAPLNEAVYQTASSEPQSFIAQGSSGVKENSLSTSVDAPDTTVPAENSPATPYAGEVDRHLNARLFAGNYFPADFGNGNSVNYQWLRDGTEIPGATDIFYFTTPKDMGSTLSVTASYETYSDTGKLVIIKLTEEVKQPGLIQSYLPAGGTDFSGNIVSTGVMNEGGPSSVGSGLNFVVQRQTPDGRIDNKFGTLGKIVLEQGIRRIEPDALAVSSNGKLLVAGPSKVAENFPFITRLNNDGSTDLKFGMNGRVYLGESFGNLNINSLTIEKNGQIVAGIVDRTGFGVAKLDQHGRLVTNFGVHGKLITPHNNPDVFKTSEPQGSGNWQKNSAVLIKEQIQVQSESFRYKPGSFHEQGFYNHRISLACQYVFQNIDRPITLSELEDKSALSSRALQYSFKNAFGLTPMQWVREQKLLLSRKLLSNPKRTDTVTSVALGLGFNSPAMFTAYYKVRFGETPSQTLSQGLASLP